MTKYIVSISVLIAMFTSFSFADIITLTVGEYNSPNHNTGTYYDLYDVGSFDFSLSGQEIVSATVTGQWGNSQNPTSANNTVFLDNFAVANTYDYSPSPYNNYNVQWSFTFTDFSIFQDGHCDLTVAQTSEYVIRLAPTTLRLETRPSASVPEPGTGILILSGVLLIGAFRKKKN